MVDVSSYSLAAVEIIFTTIVALAEVAYSSHIDNI